MTWAGGALGVKFYMRDRSSPAASRIGHRTATPHGVLEIHPSAARVLSTRYLNSVT